MENKFHYTIDQRRQRILVVALLDVLCIAVSFFMGLWIRYEFSLLAIPPEYKEIYYKMVLPWIALSLTVFTLFGLYRSIWSFVSIDELYRIVLAYLCLSVLCGIVSVLLPVKMPISFYVLGMLFSFCSTVGLRFSYRLLRYATGGIHNRRSTQTGKNVMIIGAGEAGRALLREILNRDKLDYKVVCLIDDNPSKKGRLLEGVPIVGDRDQIPEAVKKYKVNKIIYAIPTSSGQTKKEILDICSETGCEIQVVPGIYQLVNGDVSVATLRDVEVQDLLGRDPVTVDWHEIGKYITDKRVMVTGGGGSIGSELCRQIAKNNPEELVIFDIYENNAYDIQMELMRKYPYLKLTVLIGSVRNTARVESVIDRYRPQLVFHAAAHKHVPLMEESPHEAIKNNVMGTFKMAKAAAKFGVKKFVLISTDKAVNPTNIMGASKRLCEMVVQMMGRKSDTDFSIVRFGNVLGSNGSVIPLFKKQIENGGPVTVTHPEITRFFMTIPEAVSLVLQSGCYSKGGEIFVLDMGQPVKIADMAKNLIRLSGYEPDVDIKIEYTGLRPGEKLYEELLMSEEGLQETENKLIHIGKPIEMDDELFMKQLKLLDQASKDESTDIKKLVAQIVTTYHYVPKK